MLAVRAARKQNARRQVHRKAQKGSNPYRQTCADAFAWQPIDFSSRVLNLSSRTIRLRQPPKWRDRQEVNHTGTI